MYQVYKYPTKYPLSNGAAYLYTRKYHDKIMKHNIENPRSGTDTSKPQKFPLRRAKHVSASKKELLHNENGKIMKAIIQAKPDTSVSQWKNEHMKKIELQHSLHARAKTRVNKKKQQKIDAENQRLSNAIKHVDSEYSQKGEKLSEHNKNVKGLLKRKEHDQAQDIFLAANFHKNVVAIQRRFRMMKLAHSKVDSHNGHHHDDQQTNENQTENKNDDKEKEKTKEEESQANQDINDENKVNNENKTDVHVEHVSAEKNDQNM